MIRCLPKGLCSWDFDLEGCGHHASVKFDWMGEQGAIVADGVRYAVRKHGVFSGRWTLEERGDVIARAQKTSLFTRSFEIVTAAGDFEVRAESAFSRAFRVVQPDGAGVAAIKTDHLFTRRATIEIAPRTDFVTLCFSFWLAVLTWRRHSRNSS